VARTFDLFRLWAVVQIGAAAVGGDSLPRGRDFSGDHIITIAVRHRRMISSNAIICRNDGRDVPVSAAIPRQSNRCQQLAKDLRSNGE